MADQGSIATLPGEIYSTLVALRAPLFQASGQAVWHDDRLASTRVALRAPAFIFRGASVLVGVQDRLWGGGRDETEGNPASPSLRVAGGGVFRFRIPIDSGQRSVSVKCKETSALAPRPVLRICENGEVGLLAAVEAVAPAGSGWVTVGPATFTATAKGGVVIELVSFSLSWEGECYWDSLTVA